MDRDGRPEFGSGSGGASERLLQLPVITSA
jgi:hypothetical protein